jgi:hypothetical protein
LLLFGLSADAGAAVLWQRCRLGLLKNQLGATDPTGRSIVSVRPYSTCLRSISRKPIRFQKSTARAFLSTNSKSHHQATFRGDPQQEGDDGRIPTCLHDRRRGSPRRARTEFYLIAAAALHAFVRRRDQLADLRGLQDWRQLRQPARHQRHLRDPADDAGHDRLAFGAGHSGRVKRVTAGPFGLMVIQFVLGFFGGLQSTLGSAIAGLHGLNAMAIVAVTVYLLSATWAYRREPLAQPSAEAAPRSGMGASGL